MGIGDIIRVHRVELNMKQQDLGDRIHRDFTYISRIETGREEPKIDELLELAKLFECELIKAYAVLKQVKPLLNMRM